MELGRTYSRADIHEMIGGGIQEFMPSAGGRVVAICVRNDRGMQAFSPREILIGTKSRTRERTARFVSQDEAVPVFVRRAPHAWEFAGRWELDRYMEEAREIRDAMSRAGVDRNVSGVLWLRPVSVA